MNIGWNFRREHLRLQQRSHYVIPNGGDQPNVVPQNAAVWYYFRETDYEHIKELWEIGEPDVEGGGDDDQYRGHIARAGIGLARAHEQDRGGDHVRATSRPSDCRSGAPTTRSWPSRCSAS